MPNAQGQRNALHAIAAFEATKGAAALAGLIGVLDLLHRDVRAVVMALIGRFGLDPEAHYPSLLLHYADLLPDADVYVTDWHNARDIPVSAGKFDIEDYTLYLVEFMRALGPDTHVIAICQPAPLTLAATAYLAAEDPDDVRRRQRAGRPGADLTHRRSRRLVHTQP